MEWTSNTKQLVLESLSDSGKPLSKAQQGALTEAHALLSAAAGGGVLNRAALGKAVLAVTDTDPTEEIIEQILEQFGDVDGGSCLSVNGLRMLLQVLLTGLALPC